MGRRWIWRRLLAVEEGVVEVVCWVVLPAWQSPLTPWFGRRVMEGTGVLEMLCVGDLETERTRGPVGAPVRVVVVVVVVVVDILDLVERGWLMGCFLAMFRID